VKPLLSDNTIVSTWKLFEDSCTADTVPSWTEDIVAGNTVYFGPEQIQENFFDDVIKELPIWMQQMHNRELKVSKQELIELFSSNKKCFDLFSVSVR